MIDEARAIQIASEDAARVYRELETLYRPEISVIADGWRVEFVLRDRDAHGGGAIYEIGGDGVVRSKKYYQ